MKALTTLFVIGIFLMPAVLADDADDVKAAVQRHYAALNAGDASALMQLHAAEGTRFGPRGELLEKLDSREERRNQQAVFEAGPKYNLQARHIDVRIYGSSTAVATSYGVGSLTFSDVTTQVNNRITAVLIKQGGQWKVVHRHISPVVLLQ